MYQKHWNLKRKPFTTAYDAALLHYREPFADAYHSLSLAARIPPGTFWITGPKGTGKSTLLRKLEESFADEAIFSLLNGKFLNSRSALIDLLENERGLAIAGTAVGLEPRLANYFQSKGYDGRTAIIAIDDADTVEDPEVVAELQTLQRLGHERGWPLICFFTGRQVAELTSGAGGLRFREIVLQPPNRHECGAIIEHRLAAAGAQTTIFTPSALETIISRADGDIYKLLTLAELCLQVGFVAHARVVDDELVRTRVEPFIERFFIGDEEPERRRPAVTRPLEEETLPADEGGTVFDLRRNIIKFRETVRSAEGEGTGMQTAAELWRPERQKLVSKAELETYRASSIKADTRPEIEKITSLFKTGKLDITRAIGEAAAEPEPEAPPVPVAVEEPPAEPTLESRPTRELYDEGKEIVAEMLDHLRRKQFIHLHRIRRLAAAIVSRVERDNSLLRIAIGESDRYEMPEHFLNVAILSTVCAKGLRLVLDGQTELAEIALMHDVGHLHCGEELLLSENRFDRQDFKMIKQHPMVGRELIQKFTDGSPLMAEVIGQEHERDDGLGYPNYLVGEDIHLYAKIIGVCDVFEAMSHSRAHRRALTPEEALVQINSQMIRRTDPRIITALRAAILKALAEE